MRSFGSYLCLMLMIIFWLFRLIVAFTNSIAVDIGFSPMNMNMEIILLYIAFICILIVAKRKLIGSIIYVIAYGAYFGVDLFHAVKNLIQGGVIIDYSNTLASVIAIMIAVAALVTMLADKNRMAHPVDKKTDWFYKNEEYDRKLDERADQNEYRNY